MRAFIALPLPLSTVESLMAVGRDEAAPPGLRWARPENLHITLRFLGELDDGALPDLYRSVECAASGLGPFTLTCAELGCFPSPRAARVIWAGLGGDLGSLQSLAEGIVEHTRGFGKKPEDRPFSPHVTLARATKVTVPEPRAVRSLIERYKGVGFGVIPVTEVLAYESVLSRSGASYHVHHRARLGNASPRS